MDTAPRPKALRRRVHQTVKDLGIASAIGLVLLCLLPFWMRFLSVYIGAVIFLTNIIYKFVVDCSPKGQIPISGKAVIISGCDSGFGHMLAKRLDDLGFQVFAGCLFPDGEGAQKLMKTGSDQIHILKMDVTKDQDIKEAVTFVDEKLGDNKLWAVVCNAGFNTGAEINWTDVDTIKSVLEVNTFGVVRLTKAFLPKITEAKGRVVAVASAAGRYTYPGMVPYCMSKQAVVSFCDGLRLEMAYRWGIKVVTIEPFMYKTNITQESYIMPYLQKTWEQAPEDIKRKYPDGYLQTYLKATLQFLNYSISDRVKDVIDCLEEAIMAKNPKYAYSPGTTYSRFSTWILRSLPKPIADFLILSAFITPEQLENFNDDKAD